MRVIPIGIVSLFLVSPIAALPTFGAGYDLKCEGKISALNGPNAGAHASPFTMRLHVDLDHKLFCQDSCENREKISKVLASNIIFRAVGGPLPNRLWVADTGQFSYTWGKAAAQDEKPAMRFARGFCTKVVTHSTGGRDSTRQKAPLPAPKPRIGQKLAEQARSKEVSAGEFRALINIQNHLPVPAWMHTSLWLKGLAQYDDGLWVPTDKGEAIISRQKLAGPPRPKELDAGEIRALIDIQNHLPVPASMHTSLWLKGLARYDDGLWVLTDKGEAIISSERR